MKRHHARVRKAEDQVLALMQEDLQQLELVQSLQVEPQVLERFQVGLNKSLSAKGRRRRWSVTSNAFISGVSQLGTGALLLWGATRVAAGALSYGSLSAMLQLLALFRGRFWAFPVRSPGCPP
jgi:ABC-type bacteriocin/lantibiotic exporter with double-glycine peptidase domain